jgi:ferredoxin/flavodoxin---NADP+ reductase
VQHRAAVVGAGPSGFYTVGMLLQQGFSVDLFDALPTPFGLIRAGVAPDHPKIKAVTRVFDKIAGHERFRFAGAVTLGREVPREALVERYHVVVYAMGTAGDNALGIPGEHLPGSHAATDFVGWYYGHPANAGDRYDLSTDRAVVIGNGNVAVDVARMLMLDPAEVAVTDTADHAVVALAAAEVREVVVLGRRGPVQAAFTTPELRELGELTRADVVVAPEEAALDPSSAAWLEGPDGDATTRRNVELLRAYASRPLAGHEHRVVLRFLRSPIEILGIDRVEGVRVAINAIVEQDGRFTAVPTGAQETIRCGLVIRAIGYRGSPVHGVPFDDRRGLVRNAGGRVVGEDGTVLQGEYAVGWIKRGPSGVIGTNKKCAADTTARIAEDLSAGRLNTPTCEPTDAWLRALADTVVDWPAWRVLDRHEIERGEPDGRPRNKLVRVADMHNSVRLRRTA